MKEFPQFLPQTPIANNILVCSTCANIYSIYSDNDYCRALYQNTEEFGKLEDIVRKQIAEVAKDETVLCPAYSPVIYVAIHITPVPRKNLLLSKFLLKS